MTTPLAAGRRVFIAVVAVLAIVGSAAVAYASHSWGSYHWARTSNPFTLKLGDNVSVGWDQYLRDASLDWSQSSVLDTVVVAGGTNPKNCKPTTGRVEVCNASYGRTGWLGIAQIWVSGSHITKGAAKMNDTYFKMPSYNTAAWKRFVMCQEIAHTFGLDHQDEDFSNANLGSCMDYTADPDGPPSNEHPNAHDFEQLELIYAHLDTFTTVGSSVTTRARNARADADIGEGDDWGQVERRDSKSRPSLYKRDLGRGEKVYTFVLWANGEEDRAAPNKKN